VIVLDASVLIAHLDARDTLHDQAEEALFGIASTTLAASPLTVAEVLVGPARAGRLDEAVAALRTIGLAEVPLAPTASARLAELRASSGMKLPDCCVILAAETSQADAVVTFDRRLEAEAARRGFPAP
jgi:predicted nucleic acid-binding protein